MKFIKYLIPSILFVGMLSGCGDMDQYPQDKLTPETYFNSEQELKLYTNYFYKLMPGGSDMYMEEGEHMVVPSPCDEILGIRTIPTDANEAGWTWAALRKINYYLQNSGRCKDVSARNHYDGVAYFFRAYFYFEKVKRFGDVPWYDQPLASDDDDLLYKARDSRELVVTHILEDLDKAIEMLPAKKTVYEVDKWTAYALKSRICLFEGTFRKYHKLPYEWENLLRAGADAAYQLMTKGDFKLYTDGKEPYRDLFASLDARTDEVILARNYDATLGIKHNANAWSTQRTTGFTKRFVNSYLKADGTRFTDQPGYETMLYVNECANRDPRLSQTVYCPGYIVKGAIKTSAVNLTNTLTGYKYIKYVMDASYNTWDGSAVDLPIFRLAEQYLNYAECMAELGTLTQNDLDISLNKLRDRVGMPHLNMAWANANIDPYLLNEETGYPNVTKSGNTGVILEIRRERMIELVLEGFHYDDIMRWKEGKLFEKAFYGQYFPGEGKYDLTGDGKADLCLYTNIKPSGLGLTFLKIGTDITLSNGTSGYMLAHGNLARTWIEDRDYLYPLPINERILSKGILTQNPGWNDGLAY